MNRRPSDVAQQGAAGWYNRCESSYCRELRAHEAEFRETRRRCVVALIFTVALGIVLLIAGRIAMAGYFGGAASIVVGFFAGYNELVLARTTNALARDCPGFDDPRSIA
jgi:hypothetical protein